MRFKRVKNNIFPSSYSLPLNLVCGEAEDESGSSASSSSPISSADTTSTLFSSSNYAFTNGMTVNFIQKGSNKSLLKSLPIHCIVELTTTIGIGGSSNIETSNSHSHSGGTALALVSSSIDSNRENSNGKIEVDDFVIIPFSTPFQALVSTVLSIIGYPKESILQSEGTISLRNWKPLKLSQVCDSPEKTVGDILNDLTNHATLRVLVTKAKGGGTADDLKEKLLRLLLAQSSTLLMGAGCPLDEMTLSQLVKGNWPQNLADDVKRRFDNWYTTHFGLVESLQHHHQTQLGHHPSHNNHQQICGNGRIPCTIVGSNGTGGSNSTAGLSTSSPHHLTNGVSLGNHHSHHHSHHQIDLQSNKSYDEHPAFHSQKTRMRTSFDSEQEIPLLQKWFSINPHPSRHQIQQYVIELNRLECRKDRKPLDVNNVIYWFKNNRASQKRNELRYSFSHHAPNYYHTGDSQTAAAHLLTHSLSGGGDDRFLHHQQSKHLHHHSSSSNRHEDEMDDEEEEEEEEIRGRRQSGESCGKVGESGQRDQYNEESLHYKSANNNINNNNENDSGNSRGSSSLLDETEEMKGTRRDNGIEEEEEERESSGAIIIKEKKKKKEKDNENESSSEMVRGVKDEQSNDDDFISVDVEMAASEEKSPSNQDFQNTNIIINNNNNNNEPKDLRQSSKSLKVERREEEIERVNSPNSSCSLGEIEREGGGEKGCSNIRKRESSSTTTSDCVKSCEKGEGIIKEKDYEDKNEKEVKLEKETADAGSEEDEDKHPSTRRINFGHNNNNDLKNENISNPPSSTSSISPRSSPGGGLETDMSPNHHFSEFQGNAPASMVNRFHHFFDHSSFLAYRHFNSFNFVSGGGANYGQNCSPDGSSAFDSIDRKSVAAAAAAGLLPQLKSGSHVPGLDIFQDFPPPPHHNAQSIMQGMGNGNRGAQDSYSRLKNEDIFSQRSPNSDLITSLINRGEMGLNSLSLGGGVGGAHHHHSSQHYHSSPNHSLALDERRKRNRTFIDPVSEVPRLETWFGLNTHPSHNLILKYTEELNRMPYRQKFPKLEPKNVQFWFKNRRAKTKRLKMQV